MEEDDSREVKIIKAELLRYKPHIFTLDDRHLQLERILDALDEVKETKDSRSLLSLIDQIIEENQGAAIHGANLFLNALLRAKSQIQPSQSATVARL